MPDNEAFRRAVEIGIIASDLTLARLIETDAAIGAVDGSESGDLTIAPDFVFRPRVAGRPIKQEHVDALASAGLLKPDVTLAELVEASGDGDLLNGASAELVGSWFLLRQRPGLAGIETIPQ